MASIDLLFNGATTTIQCNENDIIKEILNKFCIKVGQNMKDLCFLYGGGIIELDKTFYQVASSEDKKRKKLSIIVTNNKTSINQNSNSKKSKYITCPKCNDTARISIQNFKIKLYGCKEGPIYSIIYPFLISIIIK